LWWINDAVKKFESKKATYSFLNLGLNNLMIRMATPDYMLAMKVLSARAGTNDEIDILFLIKYLKLKSRMDVIKIIKKYYPKQQLKIESKILLKSIFGEK